MFAITEAAAWRRPATSVPPAARTRRSNKSSRASRKAPRGQGLPAPVAGNYAAESGPGSLPDAADWWRWWRLWWRLWWPWPVLWWLW